MPHGNLSSEVGTGSLMALWNSTISIEEMIPTAIGVSWAIHQQWERQQTLLHDGRVEIDSIAVGNLIRPVALTRKNALSPVMMKAAGPGAASHCSSPQQRSMASSPSPTSRPHSKPSLQVTLPAGSPRASAF